jgi:hypothetical protein
MWAASKAASSVLWTAEWMAVLMAWMLADWLGHHWADPLALVMVVKMAAERVALWALKKVEKWDVYLVDYSVVKSAVLLAARWAESSATLKILCCLINSREKVVLTHSKQCSHYT